MISIVTKWWCVPGKEKEAVAALAEILLPYLEEMTEKEDVAA